PGLGQRVGGLATDALARPDDHEAAAVETEESWVVRDGGVVRGRHLLLPGDGGVDLVPTLLELGDDLRAEQLDGAHDRLVRQEAELDVAEQLIDTDVRVLL